MASAWTGPASSSESAAWTSRCRCRGLSPSKRELTTATRKCVSLPGGTAWPPLSLRSSSTSGFRACSNFVRMAASTGPHAPDPALPRDRQTRPAMGNRRLPSCPLSIGCRRDKNQSSEGQGLPPGEGPASPLSHPHPPTFPEGCLRERAQAPDGETPPLSCVTSGNPASSCGQRGGDKGLERARARGTFVNKGTGGCKSRYVQLRIFVRPMSPLNLYL